MALLALLALGGLAAPTEAFVYWANIGTGTIGRANLDGTGANQSFITGARAPRGGGRRRPRLLGQHAPARSGAPTWTARAPTKLHHRRRLPVGVAVDAAHVYWTDAVHRRDRARQPRRHWRQPELHHRRQHPSGVAVDGGHVYWANNGTDTIGRANLDGTGANQSFITGASSP